MFASFQKQSRSGHTGAAFLVLLLGFGLGITVFTPWAVLCERLVQHVDSKLVNMNLTWTDLRRAGPSGFRIDNLTVGFDNAPGALHFEHADLRFGFSPLARVRLNTSGEECYLNIFRSGLLEIDGQVDLTYLLGGGGVQGDLYAKGGIMPSDDGRLLGSGWLDLRSRQMVLPDGKRAEELALTLEINGSQWAIKNVSIRQPVDFQGKGVAELDKTQFMDTNIRLKGEIAVGDTFHPVDVDTRLGTFFTATED